MPGRQIVGGELYRYAFQGQEKDPETGKEAFQLRLWDSRIGRWLTVDPAGQYYSPYMAMDNRPNMSIDPTGGCTVGIDCPKSFDWMEYGTFVLDEVNLSGGIGIPWGTESITGGGSINFRDAEEAFKNSQENMKRVFQSISDWRDNWSESNNIFAKLSYGFVNDFYVTFQTLNPFDDQLTNFNGTGVVKGSNTHLENGVNALTTFIPSAKISEAAIPLKSLNAAQFSKTFKNSIISSASPKLRGILNVKLNQSINILNKPYLELMNRIYSGEIVDDGIQISKTINKN